MWPAIDEAIGIAFLEAQACGLPVVGGDSPGVAAVVAHGRSGLLVPLDDVPALATAVQRLVHDAPARRRFGACAATYVRERHGVDRAARQLDGLLRALAGRQPAGTATSPC